MTENANILTTPSVTPSRHQVIALAYDGLCTFEFGVAVEIFGLPRPEMGDNWYQFAVAAVDEGPLCATGGIRLMTDGGPELLARADTIVVPGWRGVDARSPRRCAPRWLPPTPADVGLFLSVPGVRSRRRRAAQWPPGDNPLALHRGAAVPFSADPVVEDVLYVGDALLMTSAGSAAGIDLVCIWCVKISAAKPPTSSPAARRLSPSRRRSGAAGPAPGSPQPGEPAPRSAV